MVSELVSAANDIRLDPSRVFFLRLAPYLAPNLFKPPGPLLPLGMHHRHKQVLLGCGTGERLAEPELQAPVLPPLQSCHLQIERSVATPHGRPSLQLAAGTSMNRPPRRPTPKRRVSAPRTRRTELVLGRLMWVAHHEAGHLLVHLFFGHTVGRAVVRTLDEVEGQPEVPPSSEATARAAARVGFVEASGPPLLVNSTTRQFKEQMRKNGLSGAALASALSYARAWVRMDLVIALAGPAAQGQFERRPLDQILQDKSSAGDAEMIQRLLAGWTTSRERMKVRKQMADIAEALVRSRRGRAFVRAAAALLLTQDEVGSDVAAELFEHFYGRPTPSWTDWAPYWAAGSLDHAKVRSGWLPPPLPEHLPKAEM